MMMAVFYRAHWTDCPPLDANAAWSAPWGTTYGPDGSTYECVACDGTGEGRRDCSCTHRYDPSGRDCDRCDGTGYLPECESCGGIGHHPSIRGYSCCETPGELIDYLTYSARDGVADDDTPVIIFEGERTGTGIDGEPTVVPTRTVQVTTWADFRAKWA
ncbi:hypothetical protein [Streptomyces tsukubensis]|uniref:hypothetical protein n=1 Tax=Streptomyces tsukubensis TaxID=83656 RepID=UPI00344FA5D5